MTSPAGDQSCLNCNYYAMSSSSHGVCVRNPPRAFQSDTVNGVALITAWPPVDNNDWCGAWGLRYTDAGASVPTE